MQNIFLALASGVRARNLNHLLSSSTIRLQSESRPERLELEDTGIGSCPYVLLVDSQPEALEPIGVQLKETGYHVVYATNIEQAIECTRRMTPVLVIVDLMQPARAGLDLCRVLRQERATETVPIIVVSACADETDRVVGLELGADDYIAKPFNARELKLRARKLLKQTQIAASADLPSISLGSLVVDMARRTVSVEGALVEFTDTEYRLLELLARRNGVVQRRGELFREVWKFQPEAKSRTLDTHLRRVRRKLGVAGRYLETVRGVGYRFHV